MTFGTHCLNDMVIVWVFLYPKVMDF